MCACLPPAEAAQRTPRAEAAHRRLAVGLCPPVCSMPDGLLPCLPMSLPPLSVPAAGQYVGLCIAMCVLAVFTQFLKAIRLRVEMRWAAQARARQQCCCAPGDLEGAPAASKDGMVDDKDTAAVAGGGGKSCCSDGLAAAAPVPGEVAVPTSTRPSAWRRQGALVVCGRQLITRDQVGEGGCVGAGVALGGVLRVCGCAAGCCCSCHSRCAGLQQLTWHRGAAAWPGAQVSPRTWRPPPCPAPALPAPLLQARRNFWRASFTFVVIFLDYGGLPPLCPVCGSAVPVVLLCCVCV